MRRRWQVKRAHSVAPRHYRNDVAPGVFGVFAYWGAAAAFGQEQPVEANGSRRSTSKVSGWP